MIKFVFLFCNLQIYLHFKLLLKNLLVEDVEHLSVEDADHQPAVMLGDHRLLQ